MLLIGQTPRLKIEFFLSPLDQTFNDDEDLVVMVEQMKWVYVSQNGKHIFLGFKKGVTFMKMKVLGKKISNI